jgi:predicted ATPase
MRRFDVAGSAEEVTQTLTSSWLSTVTPDDVDRYPGLLAIAEWARRIQPYVVLDPNRLREPSKVTDRGIGAAGDSLAGFLRYLQRDRPDSFERVHARVEEAYDRLEAVNLDVEDGSLYSLEVQERWTDDNPFLNVRQASDGLLRLFAFAAMPEVEPPPTLLMIDELENGVHPQLLGALVDLLQELSNHSIQIVATSHSPVVLNWVDDHSGVLLTSRDASGCAHVTPLDSTPGYDYFRSAYDAGEMWLAAGEQGLIDGPAATR